MVLADGPAGIVGLPSPASCKQRVLILHHLVDDPGEPGFFQLREFRDAEIVCEVRAPRRLGLEGPHLGELPVASGELLHHHVLSHGARLILLREAGDDRLEFGAALLALDDDVEGGLREDAVAERIEARARLSLRGARTGGALRIGAIGGGLALANRRFRCWMQIRK